MLLAESDVASVPGRAPPWWTWADGTTAAFLSYNGMYGFFAAVRYSMVVT